MLNEKQITSFRALVLDYYATNKRDLPWRQTTDPYKIMVSEIMLQQTQVDRVIPKYIGWIKRFPDSKTLASSSLKEVLTHWSGLGYNRRGQNLLKAAQMVELDFAGSFESFKSARNLKKDPLTTLPGIGSYTAAAIRAFAWNQPTIVVETNIRTVFIHHFFPNTPHAIEDKQLLPLLETTMDRNHPREWYNALMDYGAHLKNTVGNVCQKSKSYAKQASFVGSNRQLRGKILRYLLHDSPVDRYVLQEVLKEDKKRVEALLAQLAHEALIVLNENNQISIK